MRIHIPCTAVGLALAAVAPAAHAETIVTRHVVSQPVEIVRTVTTTRTTTRTIRPAVRRGAVVTRRTAVAPAPAIAVAPPIYDAAAPVPVPAPYPEPVYDVEAPVPPAPIVNPYPRPVYNVAAPAPAIVAPVVDETVAGPGVPVPPDAVGPPMPTYHYVYEWDRVLVIDDATGIAVQALPR